MKSKRLRRQLNSAGEDFVPEEPSAEGEAAQADDKEGTYPEPSEGKSGRERKKQTEEKSERESSVKVGAGQRDDFAGLVEKFRESARDSIDSYQESGPREILLTSVYCDSRSGLACTTDEQGIPHLIVTGVEPGAKKTRVRQRFFIGIQTEAVTKGRVFRSESLKTKRAPKPFDITPQVDQLLKATIPPAQDEGDKIQRKIDEENYEWFPVFLTPAEENIVAEDIEPDPDLKMVKDLVAFARGEVADRLGAKAERIDVELIKITEHMLYADSLGSQTDFVYPRVSFVILVKTKTGNTAIGVIRGSGGTIKDILARHTKEPAPSVPSGQALSPAKDVSPEEVEPRTIISNLVDEVVKEALDLDRAQTVTVIGASECPVILSPQAAGVLAHEVFGHTCEADIICENRRKKDVGVQLKSRIGSQVSDYPRLSIIDTPAKEVSFDSCLLRYNWGALPVDGYGNHGKPVTVIENGTMVAVLVDRHTFNEIISGLRDPGLIEKTGVTGNVRRQMFDRDPLIRMRNTFIVPDEKGASSKEEMARLIPATKKGLYVKTCHGGSINPDSGDFQINANLCYLIENRTITDKPVRNVTITGNIKQVGMIKAIGSAKTMDSTFSGWCGKNGQSVPVDSGGPIIYIESARIVGGSFRSWLEITEDYFSQHRQVMAGKRGAENISLPEFRAMIGDREPQDRVCLLAIALPLAEELSYLMGSDTFPTHEIDEEGKLVERRDRYE
ncbi:MAG: TldD/PmbA family protein [Anaerolineae bacterium]